MNLFRTFMELDSLHETKALKEYSYDDSTHKVKVVYENSKYAVEFHPDAPKQYWVLDRSVINPLHAEETFYDADRAIDFADDLANKLDESARPELIAKLKVAGKNYNFSKYTDAQLYRMWQRLQTPAIKKVAKEPEHDLDLDFELEQDYDYCECGMRLTDFGQCPRCDFGEEDLTEDLQYCWFGYYLDKNGKKKIIYATKDSTSHDPDEGAEKLEDMIPEPYTKFVFGGNIDNRTAEREGWTLVEGIFDSKPMNRSSWLSASGNKINLNNTNTAPTQSQHVPSQTQQSPATTSNGKYQVRIVSHGGRLRALATDGVHPAAWVAFPNDLRQFEGQLYEVDQLIWNGKNYRVAGNIVEI